jgi:hypothetical protein
MRDGLQSDREFNTPAEMLTRATFLAMLATFTAGILLTLAGLIAAEVRLSLAGLAALIFAGVSRAWLQKREALEPSERALAEFAESSPPPDEASGRQLLALLEQWEQLEQKRGTPEFDPWALQALRNDIRKVVESDSALSQLFSELQRAA